LGGDYNNRLQAATAKVAVVAAWSLGARVAGKKSWDDLFVSGRSGVLSDPPGLSSFGILRFCSVPSDILSGLR
jgi:hypothetical protein